MTAVWDTGAAIRVIDAQSVETCTPTCWCTLGRNSEHHTRMRWMPGDPILRFPLESEAA